MTRLPDYPFALSYGPDDDRLHNFYIPALERSVTYRRTAGFFSSSALAIAATGVARLIQNGGTMHLLCGAKLSEQDVEAIKRGKSLEAQVGDIMAQSLEEHLAGSDMEKRLEVLAWLISVGRLEIRVVLRKGSDGQPLPAPEAYDYYHPKEGIFEDSEGNQLAFSGSSNESAHGWKHNYETFHVFTTWDRQAGDDVIHAAPYYITPVERRFEELWNAGETSEWISLDIPEAARQKLLDFHPSSPPTRDPLERPPDIETPDSASDEPRKHWDQLVCQFLREAPYLANSKRLGVETSPVTPWPHQDRVVDSVVGSYPKSFLFCDEVGLGKTIEVTLAFRQLLISGRVQRSLFLVPASIVKQWQEEIWEKCALNIPRYERGRLRDVFDREVSVSGSMPWNSVDHLIVSSQLAKRRARQEELLEADPWDLIVVDEAHHARRMDFSDDDYRPNRLLQLLEGRRNQPGLRDRTDCLYLLTATPMQVHPVEVWDLLRLVGLGGRWGAVQRNFLGFFETLREAGSDRDWDFLLDMVEDNLATGGQIDPHFESLAKERLGPVEWDMIKNLPDSGRRQATIRQLSSEGQKVLDEFLRQHTPVQRYIWRNTRNLLHQYRERGLLKERVPRRDPQNQWIPMTQEERDLYERIEDYISNFFQKYEAERKGLGFVMAVYRRRLTSSFYAITRSLERRLDFLQGQDDPLAGLTDEDVEQEELDLDISDTLSEEAQALFTAEIEYVEDFLRDLRRLRTDSKLEFLKARLRELFAERDTVILFTQYTDTMDYLREELRQVYGDSVGCYSGRGGEVWDGAAWVPTNKEQIKESFRQGNPIKILICTESASEGLNMQTCGVLINYDMPWNPMRVEQRIGRIDRIGQRYDVVWVRNYFYEDTVEAKVYTRLSDRIDWFEHVVGKLQPILHQVGKTIERVAMRKGDERQRLLDEEIEEIRNQLDEQRTTALDIDAFAEPSLEAPTQESSHVSLADLEKRLTGARALGASFSPMPEGEGSYDLIWKGTARRVTFEPDVFDKQPYSTELITYGNPLLGALLDEVGRPPSSDEPTGIALLRERSIVPLSTFTVKHESNVTIIHGIEQYERALQASHERWSDDDQSIAYDLHQEAQDSAIAQLIDLKKSQWETQSRALLEEARIILIRSALIRSVLSERAGLFDQVQGPVLGSEAVPQLARDLGKPYPGLAKILGGERLNVTQTHPFYEEIYNKQSNVLQRRLNSLKDWGMDVLKRWKKLNDDRNRSMPSGEDRTSQIEAVWLKAEEPH